MNWLNFLCIVCLNLYFCVNAESIFDHLKDDLEEFNQQQYPETTQVRHSYDFIIVGAGSAGCVVANRLSENENWTILLIEAGGRESRKYDIPGQAAQQQNIDVDWGYVSEPLVGSGLALKEQRIYLPRGKVVGGSSVINGIIYNRGNPADFDNWANKYKCDGWNFMEIEKYYRKLETYAVPNTQSENVFGKHGPFHVQKPSYQSEFSGAQLKAGEQYGFKPVEINGPEQLGISRQRTNVKEGYRFSANSAYLVPIRASRPNLELKYNCFVTKILFNENKWKPEATGVQFCCESKNYTVYANKEVIISAGAINSPQLLMLSGIGPAVHLKEMNIPVLKDLPVGRNLMDHVKVNNCHFLVNRSVFPSMEEQEKQFIADRSGPLAIPGMTEVIAFSFPQDNGVQALEQFFTSTIFGEGFYKNLRLRDDLFHLFAPYFDHPGFTMQPQILKPKSRGVLLLRSKNPFDPPKIFLNYFSNCEDFDLLVKGVKESIRISEQSALREWNATLIPYNLPMCSQYEFNTDEYWACSIRAMASTNYHQCGTCKMGPRNDPSAVVDLELKVIGVDNLRVIDASIMPEIIGGHINGPVLMIGEKGADMIKATYGQKSN